MENINERFNEYLADYEKSSENINHKSYSPSSPEFISNIMIGLKAYLDKELLLDDIEDEIEETKDEIKDELMGAENYLGMFMKTKDPIYKDMAKDELKHAYHFMQKAKQVGLDMQKLDTYNNWHASLLKRINETH